MSESFKVFLAGVVGIFATITQTYGLIIACVCLAIVFDVVTGIFAAKVVGDPITSETSGIGIYRKSALLAALFFGMFLDLFIPVSLGAVGIALPYGMPFGLMFGCYIVLTESISVAENLEKANPGCLPKWVSSLLKSGVDKLDDQKVSDGKESEGN